MKIQDYGLVGLQRMSIMMFYELQRECGIERTSMNKYSNKIYDVKDDPRIIIRGGKIPVSTVNSQGRGTIRESWLCALVNPWLQIRQTR